MRINAIFRGLGAPRIAALAAWGAVNAWGAVVINEIHYDPEDKTQPLEFIELVNTGAAAVDLAGWRFDRGIDYVFPAGSQIDPGGYVVVAENPTYLQATYGAAALGPFIGSLDNLGETIVLRDAAGDKVDQVDYKSEFPWPIAAYGQGPSMELLDPALDNDLGSHWSSVAPAAGSTILLPRESDQWRYRKGTSEASSPIAAWRELGFSEDATWFDGTASIGYGDGDDQTELNDMYGNYSSVFMRHVVNIANAAALPDQLTLHLYVDDGCIIWVNGVEVARPYMSAGEKAYNAFANKHNYQWETFTISSDAFVDGANLIAAQSFNASLTSSDVSFDIEIAAATASTGPSPGAANPLATSSVAPAIRQVGHTPRQPAPGETILITAKVTDTNGVGAVNALLQEVAPGAYLPAWLPRGHDELLNQPEDPDVLNPDYTNPANWTVYPMRDDGLEGDAVAGDDIYTLRLAAPSVNRTLLRYRIEVEDAAGASAVVPYADDLSLNFALFVYAGVPEYTASERSVHPDGAGHVYSTNLLTALPVYHLITRVEDYDECVAYDPALQISKGHPARSVFNWSGAFVYEGVVYDHIRYRPRQANNRYSGTGRRSFRYRFNRGHYLEARDEQGKKYPTKWRTLNTHKMHVFTSTHTFGLAENINSLLWEMVGVPAPSIHYAHVRMVRGADEHDQYYGDFQGLTMAQEDYDSRFLNAHDLEDGNIYKLKDGEFNGYELKRNQGADSVVTVADYEYIKSTLTPALTTNALNTIVRWDKWYPYHVVCEAVRHYDFDPDTRWHKNRVWYFEPTPGTPYGLMWVLPHDSDSTWSRGYHDERLGPGNPNNSVGIDYPRQALFGYNNTLPRPADKAGHRIAYRGVMRDLRDLVFTEEVITNMIADLVEPIRAFSLADRDRWRLAPAAVGYEPDGSLEVREQQLYDFMFVSEKWYGANIVGGRQEVLNMMLDEEDDDLSIPAKPAISYTGPAGHPVNALTFACSPFADPQGSGTFGAMEWRVGQITDPTAPAYDPADPRRYEYAGAWKSGEIAPFSDTISIPSSALKAGRTYRARVRFKDNTGRWGHWSAPYEFTTGDVATAAALVDHLRVTEIMYNPPRLTDPEFIELYNAGSVALDLNGVAFTKGVEFVLPAGASLAPGATAVVVPMQAWTNQAAFRAENGIAGSVEIYGPYAGKLSNGGEELNLKTSLGGLLIASINYNDGDEWPARADGAGGSLELRAADADPRAASSWAASPWLGGTPGLYPPVSATSIVINEILAHTDLPLSDRIELYNAGAAAVDIGGWYLSDSLSSPLKFRIPDGVVLNAGEYVVFDEADFNPNGEWNTDPGKGAVEPGHFALSSAYGDSVYLTAANGAGEALYFADETTFGATMNGASWGRYPNGAGDFYPLIGRTFGFANAAARVGDVVISELMVEPAGAGGSEALEFIEIHNRGAATENLAHWTLDGAVEFEFAASDSLAPGGVLVVVGFDPADSVALAAFQTAYGTSIVPLGPWSGQLNNLGETLWLNRPDTPPAEAPTFYPQTEEERVSYATTAPWPTSTKGGGDALQRADYAALADAPDHWLGLPPTPGNHRAWPRFDHWALEHFAGAVDPWADADADGMSNYDEYLADTDPRSAASGFYIYLDIPVGTDPLISFESSARRRYSLYAADDGLLGEWTPIFSDEAGTGGVMEWVPPLNHAQRFFRLQSSEE